MSEEVSQQIVDSNEQSRFSNGWFYEINDQWPGIALSLKVEEVLHNAKSDYQHVVVFKSATYGNVLVLDGVVQLTERDEMAYQEMIAHLPLMAHPNPKHVLIIGGGDGGVIREVVKHKGVETITICEIDKMVIECGKKYFPTVAAAWDDPRVTLICGDASEYIKRDEVAGKFDVIISDTSDPVGPAASLFESPFYNAMYKALRPGGKICTQAESMWMHLPLIEKLVRESSMIYENIEYATTQIPTYPAGQIGLLVGNKAGGDSPISAKIPREVPAEELENFRYWTPALHTASFVLPAFVEKVVEKAKKEGQEAEESPAKKQKVDA